MLYWGQLISGHLKNVVVSVLLFPSDIFLYRYIIPKIGTSFGVSFVLFFNSMMLGTNCIQNKHSGGHHFHMKYKKSKSCLSKLDSFSWFISCRSMQLTVWYFRNCYTSQLLTNTSSNTHNSEHFYNPLRTSNSLRIFTRNTIYLVKHQLLHQYNDIKSDLKRGYHWQVGVSKAFFYLLIV